MAVLNSHSVRTYLVYVCAPRFLGAPDHFYGVYILASYESFSFLCVFYQWVSWCVVTVYEGLFCISDDKEIVRVV